MPAIIARLFAACLLVALLAPPGWAQPYPAHPVRIIVPFSAAGPTDVIARIIAQKLSEACGQQVYTENFPGAGGNTGIVMAAKSAPDGYNMLAVSTGFIVNPTLYAKVPYDPIKDFFAVTLVAASPNVISTHPSCTSGHAAAVRSLRGRATNDARRSRPRWRHPDFLPYLEP